jgi:hypothetical protein
VKTFFCLFCPYLRRGFSFVPWQEKTFCLFCPYLQTSVCLLFCSSPLWEKPFFCPIFPALQTPISAFFCHFCQRMALLRETFCLQMPSFWEIFCHFCLQRFYVQETSFRLFCQWETLEMFCLQVA